MEAIQAFLEAVKQGGKQSHLNMTLIPLLAPDAGEPDYLILEEALGQGLVEITEVSQGGSVPDHLALKSDRLGVHSATGAMADLFEGQKDRLEEYTKAFRLVDCQVGAVFAAITRVTQRRKVRKGRPSS